jgi:hypothetical protein
MIYRRSQKTHNLNSPSQQQQKHHSLSLSSSWPCEIRYLFCILFFCSTKHENKNYAINQKKHFTNRSLSTIRNKRWKRLPHVPDFYMTNFWFNWWEMWFFFVRFLTGVCWVSWGFVKFKKMLSLTFVQFINPAPPSPMALFFRSKTGF